MMRSSRNGLREEKKGSSGFSFVNQDLRRPCTSLRHQSGNSHSYKTRSVRLGGLHFVVIAVLRPEFEEAWLKLAEPCHENDVWLPVGNTALKARDASSMSMSSPRQVHTGAN